MEARIKKMFHRKKDQSSEQPLRQSQSSTAATSTPALRTSLYDSTPAGGPPQTGTYPIKGNISTTALQKRRSSLRGRGQQDQVFDSTPSSFPESPHHGSRTAPAVSKPLDNDRYSSARIQPSAAMGMDAYDGRRQRVPEAPPSQDFSALSLGDRQSSSHQPPSSHVRHTPASGSNYDEAAPDQIMPGTRNANWGDSSQPYRTAHGIVDGRNHAPASQTGNAPSTNERSVREPYSSYGTTSERTNDKLALDASGDKIRNQMKHSANFNATSRSQPHDESDLTRKNSIPRKQLPNPAQSQTYGVHASSPTNYVRSGSQPNQPPTGLVNAANHHQLMKGEDTSQAPGYHNLSKSISKTPGSASTAEDVVDRAKGNTVNTEVIETLAPAIVHETVHQNIHHIREEVITREIHNHDLYHRILPVIDVEVLPPRHFLPVEGGGLVEISGSEAPGRGRNWVIAETASKIPSDQRAPRATNRFSAREFAGDEGDAKRYTTPEGFERTEETWVHPPELETGGRETGQTWPMVFGDDTAGNVRHRSPPSISQKKKSSRKSSSISSTTAPRVDRV